MTENEARAWEDTLIANMREHDGPPTFGPLAGHPILVMHSRGARSGEPRRALLTYSRDRGDYVVAGTAGGSPTTPSWVANLREDPNVTIEIGRRSFQASATIVDGRERERLWKQHVDQLPWFAEYPSKAGRDIPMVRLTAKTRLS